MMATLVIGVVTIAATLVIRILMEPERPAIAQIDADRVALPVGEEIVAVGAAAGGLSIATRDPAGQERLRVFDPKTGAAIGETLIERR
ncbi:DUF6476 family protein [Pikeienuella sp. HZG-20]|uniref:DUF6476 family protein n=1 Tax=Paludibacillus litoralis TaxID=3133267 RepID=UPI0030EE6897